MKQVYPLILLIFTIIKIPFEHNVKMSRLSVHWLPYLISPRTLAQPAITCSKLTLNKFYTLF